jgi:GlpG protein
MRKIGQLRDERQARIFSDALYARGLENDVEEDDGAFSIWVHDDDKLARGRELLEKFVLGPDAQEWQAAPQTAARKRKEEDRATARRNSNVITRERIEYERNFTGFSWVPMLLAVLSVAATLWAGELGIMPGTHDSHMTDEEVHSLIERAKRRDALFITSALPKIFAEPSGTEGEPQLARIVKPKGIGPNALPEIRAGQFWRLFTPIFLHFGILHLIFNVIWLRDLGGFIQHRFGAPYLLVFVLTVAAVSNLVQLAWTGPQFGGLSGVNYGLLGFLWMRGRFDRGGVWQLNPQIVQWMIAWFVLCFFMPGVANGAHAAGLLFGMITGFATAKIANARRPRL